LYCPHCGREMALVDGVFACAAGGMTFSRAIHETLSGRFPIHHQRSAGVEVGGRTARWFCPGCGVPLGPEMRCPSCGQSLRDQLFGLIELHPHLDESGRY
jgi:hypothetical protein